MIDFVVFVFFWGGDIMFVQLLALRFIANCFCWEFLYGLLLSSQEKVHISLVLLLKNSATISLV
jgi:hypothetical protein